MMKLSLSPLILSSLIFVGSPVLSSDNDRPFTQATRKPLPPIPARSNQVPPQEAPRRASPNPFAPRMQHMQQEEKKVQETAKASYPQVFKAEHIQLIVNAPLKSNGQGGTKRDAVYIDHMKVSTKTLDGLLNDIKQKIWDGGFNNPVYDATQITVPSSITAVFSQILHTKYNADTVQEETRKTGKPKKGCLLEYKLMLNGQPLMYLPNHAMAIQCQAKLVLSITTE